MPKEGGPIVADNGCVELYVGFSCLYIDSTNLIFYFHAENKVWIRMNNFTGEGTSLMCFDSIFIRWKFNRNPSDAFIFVPWSDSFLFLLFLFLNLSHWSLIWPPFLPVSSVWLRSTEDASALFTPCPSLAFPEEARLPPPLFPSLHPVKGGVSCLRQKSLSWPSYSSFRWLVHSEIWRHARHQVFSVQSSDYAFIKCIVSIVKIPILNMSIDLFTLLHAIS